MFSYYGSKNKIAKLYPLPKYDLIIEPFAGAAWYSVLHRDKNVLLNEKYNVIHDIWNWLINEASSELILNNADFYSGQDISQIDLPKPLKDLIGFCINRGSVAPRNIVQKWSCQVKDKPNWASTTNYQLKRVAKLLPEIKHWKTRMRDEVEKLIIDWLKSDNENATYLAHQICVLLGVSVRYFKCSKCGHKIQTTNDDSGFLCQQPMPFRTSGICAGSYDIEISEAEFNAR